MSTTLEELLAGVATYLAAVPGITTAVYPPPEGISQNRTAIVFGSDVNIATFQQSVVTGRIRVGLYMAGTNEQAAIGRADALIEPICDQFAPSNPGYHLNGTLTAPNTVDRCTVVDCQLSQVLPYKGQEYYGAVLYLDFKYRRTPGGGYAL